MAATVDSVTLGGRSATLLSLGSGEPLLLMHGLAGGTADTYRPVTGELQDRWACRALWFRGHGPSDWAESYRIEDYGRDVVELLDAAPDGPTVLVGHSLGSMVAAYVAATRPDLVRAIFLEDSPYFSILSVERHRTEVSYAFFESIRAARLAMIEHGQGLDWLTEQVAGFHAGRPGSTATYRDVAPEPVIAALASTIAQTDPAVVVPALECTLVDKLTTDMLAGIGCPAVLLAGNHGLGSAIRPSDLSLWRSTMPALEIVPVDDAGHMIHLVPKTLSRYQTELRSFLERV